MAFDLYCRIPFQETNARNPLVCEMAQVLQRSPASVARKLGNFGSFDTSLRQKGIKGLGHAGKLDREVWDEFHRDWPGLVSAAAELRAKHGFGVIEADREALQLPDGPTERTVKAKARLHQSFFRAAVLSSYLRECCITGLAIPEALVASHIVPWSTDERFRADPTNGLCMSATFDRLFDRGLLMVTEDLRVRFSERILRDTHEITRSRIAAFEGQRIRLPQRFLPNPNRLAWHRENVFRG